MGIADDKELTKWAHGAGRERAWYRQGGVEQEQGEGVARAGSQTSGYQIQERG